MTILREWAAGLCTAGIGCSLLHLLCPEGSWQRAFKMLTALFFFVCLLSPLLSLPPLIRSFVPDLAAGRPDDTLSQTTQEQVLALLERELTAKAAALLEPYDIVVKKAEAERDTLREDNIYIKRVTVTVDKQNHPVPREVYTVLEQAFETEVEVQYAG